MSSLVYTFTSPHNLDQIRRVISIGDFDLGSSCYLNALQLLTLSSNDKLVVLFGDVQLNMCLGGGGTLNAGFWVKSHSANNTCKCLATCRCVHGRTDLCLEFGENFIPGVDNSWRFSRYHDREAVILWLADLNVLTATSFLDLQHNIWLTTRTNTKWGICKVVATFFDGDVENLRRKKEERINAEPHN